MDTQYDFTAQRSSEQYTCENPNGFYSLVIESLFNSISNSRCQFGDAKKANDASGTCGGDAFWDPLFEKDFIIDEASSLASHRLKKGA